MSLSDALDWGAFHVPLWLPAVALAAVVLKLVLRWRERRQPDVARRWESGVWNSVLSGFVVWKLSPLLDSWSTIMRDPVALLLLPGNGWGVGAAIAAVAIGLTVLIFKSGERGRTALTLGMATGASVLSIALVAVALAFVPRTAPPATGRLSLSTLDGLEVSLTDAPGKVLFVNFWATWCPPCRAEIPGFVQFWNAADHRRVEIRAVDLTTSEQDPGAIRPFVTQQSMTFPVLLDSAGRAASLYAIDSIPTTLVFDPKGRLVYRHVGILAPGQMADLVTRYQGAGS